MVTAVKPVLPPTATPAADSTYEVTGGQPKAVPITEEIESAFNDLLKPIILPFYLVI